MAPRKHRNEFNTKTGTSASPPAHGRNAVEFDPVEFLHFLDGTDWTDEQKVEYATLVWNIVCEFVSMGFGVHPIQQAQDACGKPETSGTLPPSAEADVVNSPHSEIIEKFVRLNGSESVSNGEGVIDGKTA